MYLIWIRDVPRATVLQVQLLDDLTLFHIFLHCQWSLPVVSFDKSLNDWKTILLTMQHLGFPWKWASWKAWASPWNFFWRKRSKLFACQKPTDVLDSWVLQVSMHVINSAIYDDLWWFTIDIIGILQKIAFLVQVQLKLQVPALHVSMSHDVSPCLAVFHHVPWYLGESLSQNSDSLHIHYIEIYWADCDVIGILPRACFLQGCLALTWCAPPENVLRVLTCQASARVRFTVKATAWHRQSGQQDNEFRPACGK